MDSNTINLLIGICTGIVSTAVGGLILNVFGLSLNKIGKIQMSFKITSNPIGKRIMNCDITIFNNKHDSYTVRDLCLYLKVEDYFISFSQTRSEKIDYNNGGKHTYEKIIYGDESFYSFFVEPRMAKNYKTAFFIQNRSIKKEDLNNLYIGYKDIKDHLVMFKIGDALIKDCLLSKKSKVSSNFKGEIRTNQF
jgi:hypothetical protein